MTNRLPAQRRSQISTTSFRDILKKYDVAIAWLQGLGASTATGRIATYRATLAKLVAGHTDPEANGLNGMHLDIRAALYEAFEICEIYDGLAGDHDDFVRERARFIGNGPAVYTAEVSQSSSNKARNFAWELSVASRLAKADLKPEMAAGGDVTVAMQEHTIVLECKRPQARDAYAAKVKSASKQLKERFKILRSSHVRGIVAIEVTKVLNPSFGLLTAENFEVGIEDLIGEMRALVDGDTDTTRAAKNPKALGVLLRASTLAKSGDVENLVYCSQYTFTPFHQRGTVNHAIAETLSSILQD